jgi:DinB superfamily
MSTTHELAALFCRDLARLAQEIEAFPNEETLWKTLPGVTNPAGNLALHLEGNLREYVGRQLGKLPYTRKRDLEFSSKGVSKQEIAARLEDLQKTIPAVVEGLSAEQLEIDYPDIVLGQAVSTQQFLFSLYGHLNWHLGQIDYLRRGLTGNGALKLATL